MANFIEIHENFTVNTDHITHIERINGLESSSLIIYILGIKNPMCIEFTPSSDDLRLLRSGKDVPRAIEVTRENRDALHMLLTGKE